MHGNYQRRYEWSERPERHNDMLKSILLAAAIAFVLLLCRPMFLFEGAFAELPTKGTGGPPLALRTREFWSERRRNKPFRTAYV